MPTFHYTLTMPQPETHLFVVEMEVGELAQPVYDLVMPSWTPGSYLIREFARHVQEFEALCPQTGEPLSWQKVNKNTWRVEHPEHDGIRIRYKVYANELSVRTSHLDTSHGYLNGANLFMYVEGWRHHALTLTVAPPYLDWKVATGLPRAPATPASPNGAGNGLSEPQGSPLPRFHYRADDYDHLIDCPVEVGNHRLVRFEVDGVPHHMAIWGHGNEDLPRLQADTQAIVQAACDLFGQLPYQQYLFILHLTEARGGGLEHRNSSTNAVSRWSFRKPEDYERTLALLAHEFFHTWNVKRIEPTSFTEYEYRWENYTRLLWVMEGFTTYYETMILRRADLITPQRMLERYGMQILRLLQTPGRHFQSAEAASFDTWIKFYRPDENTQNTSVSYYLKGSLIALMLDLEIRRRTEGRCSLDDVMVSMYRDFTLQDKGIPDDQFQGICEQVVARGIEGPGEPASSSLQQFFDDYVRGVAELPFGSYLAQAGLSMTYGWKGDEYGERTAGLGMRLRSENGRTFVQTVFADSPAHQADISSGDELIALDGYRVSKDTIGDRLAERQVGERVTLTCFRRDELREVTIVLGQRPFNQVEIKPNREATPEQRALYEGWLGTSWPDTD